MRWNPQALQCLEQPLKVCPVPLLRAGFISQSKAYCVVTSPQGQKGKLEAQCQAGAQKPFCRALCLMGPQVHSLKTGVKGSDTVLTAHAEPWEPPRAPSTLHSGG